MKAWPLGPLLLIACTTAPVPRGHYVGTATPANPSPFCMAARATIDIIRGQFVFAPDEGTWLLRGTITTDNQLLAEREQPGADKKPYVTQLAAQWTPDGITGTYTTPRCTSALRLKP